MFENEAELRKATERIVADMISVNLAQKKVYTDSRTGKEYFNLITPNAFDKRLIAIAVLGYPEQVGVWSFTLLSQSRISETSMKPYFKEFAKNDFGLIAINPNCLTPDIDGDSFIYQLEQVVADIAPDTKIGFIGFSMGGKVLIDFLQQRPELLGRTAGLVLIDPTLSNRLEIGNIRPLLDTHTLLIASKGETYSPGDIASALLQIPKISFPGIHGEMPNKALPQIINFYRQYLLSSKS
ncbi:MAG: alpha/beta fold hydrolase [Planctomycetota bacterium]|jgi:pimeloyl-ACP methyl ester carboxylesterase